MIKKRFEQRAYPSPMFLGYQLRFGSIYASFATAKLQRADNPGKPIKGPARAAVYFRTLPAVEQLFENAQDDKLEAMYASLIENWPTLDELIAASPYRKALFASIHGIAPVSLPGHNETEQTDAEQSPKQISKVRKAAPAADGGTPVVVDEPQDVRHGSQRIRRRRKIRAVS